MGDTDKFLFSQTKSREDLFGLHGLLFIPRG